MRATKRTYFLCKSETFLLEPYLFPSSPGTILKLCAQCPRRRGTKGPSCSGINRPDQIPRGHAAPIHASKSWKPEDPGFHRDRERWKPFDESRLRIYGGTLLKRPSSPPSLSLVLLSLGSRNRFKPFHGAIWRNSCRRFPIRHLLTAASRMRRTMAAALFFDCNSFFSFFGDPMAEKIGTLEAP